MKNCVVIGLLLFFGVSFLACKKKDQMIIEEDTVVMDQDSMAIQDTTSTENVPEHEPYFWRPFFNTSRNSKSITLELPTGNSYIDFIGDPPLDPDFFDVYFGDDLQDLKLVETFDFGADNPVFDNLDINTAYYFQVITRKEGFPSDTSQLLMAVLGETPSPQFIYPNLPQTVSQFHFSFDENHFIFTEKGGDRSTFYQETNNPTAINLGTVVYGIEWSPVRSEFVYISSGMTMNNQIYPLAPIIYDVATQQEDTLFTIPFGEYSVHSINYLPDGKQLSFLSSENNSSASQYDFWSYDLATRTRQKHSNFTSSKFEIYKATSWQNDLLYLSGLYRDGSVPGVNLYTFNFFTNELTPLLPENTWRDFNPYLSPNGQKVAFFSDRSGRMHLWVYDFMTGQYTQVTDNNTYYVDDRSSRIVWEDEQTILTSIYQEDKNRMARLVLE